MEMFKVESSSLGFVASFANTEHELKSAFVVSTACSDVDTYIVAEKEHIKGHVESAVANIYAIKNLKKGWSYGSGLAFSEKTIKNTVSFYKYAKDLVPLIEISPAEDGTVLVTLGKNDVFLDVIIDDDVTHHSYLEIGIGEDFTEHALGKINIYEIIERALCEINKQPCQSLPKRPMYSSELLMFGIITAKGKKDLTGTFLKPVKTIQGSLPSTATVQKFNMGICLASMHRRFIEK